MKSDAVCVAKCTILIINKTPLSLRTPLFILLECGETNYEVLDKILSS